MKKPPGCCAAFWPPDREPGGQPGLPTTVPLADSAPGEPVPDHLPATTRTISLSSSHRFERVRALRLNTPVHRATGFAMHRLVRHDLSTSLSECRCWLAPSLAFTKMSSSPC